MLEEFSMKKDESKVKKALVDVKSVIPKDRFVQFFI